MAALLTYPILADQADLPFSLSLSAGLLVTVIVAGLLIWLQRSAFELRSLKLPGVFMLSYAALALVPAVLFTLDRDDGPARNLFFTLASAMVTFPLGVFIVRAFVKNQSQPPPAQRKAIASDYLARPPAATMKRLWGIFLAISIAVVISYVVLAPSVPLLRTFTLAGDAAALQLEREESFKLLPGPLPYFFSWARVFFLPYFGLVAAASFVRPSLSWRVRAFLSFVVAILFAAASTAKGPPIAVLAMFSALGYLMNRGSHPFRRAALFATGALVIAVVYYKAVFGEGLTIEEALGNFSLRVFRAPAEVAYYYYATFPDLLPFQGGQTIHVLATVLSGFLDVQFFDVDNFIFRAIFPYGLASGTANAVFIAYLWVDFGWAGVLFGTVLLGMLVQVLETYLEDRRDLWTIALRAYLVFAVTLFHASSISTALGTHGIIVGLATTIVLRRLFPASASSLVRSSLPDRQGSEQELGASLHGALVGRETRRSVGSAAHPPRGSRVP
ncbi:MAG: oligosaccharide repeat unit polymerase [Actinobacteria bacterium]|nr:oligosaccharide repeat unit polymerase [Actinomycetota bacterium]